MTERTQEQCAELVSGEGGSSRPIYWVVAIVALLAHGVSFFAVPLWVYPDSIDYIELAGGIFRGGDWRNELFLIRPPGYPAMLAIIFKLFGAASPIVLQIAQHGMGIVAALVTVALSLRVTRRRSVALLAGILCSSSLQVLAYCNMPLTEIPFTLAFLGATYFLVRYWQSPSSTALLICSALAGTSYIIKPIGVLFYGVAAVVVCARVWRDLPRVGGVTDWRRARRVGVFARRSGAALVVAAMPSLVIVAPWMIQSANAHTSNGTSRCLDYVLYIRPMAFDQLDISKTRSAAMRDIESVVAEAVERGLVDSGASFRDRLTVINSYRRVRGLSFAESTRLMGQAGVDVMFEHPRAVAINTIKYALWMLLSPDPVYRFVPGGEPGVDGQRATGAEFYDVSTYSAGSGSWEETLRHHASYLPLTRSPRVATKGFKNAMAAFRSRIDLGPSLIGFRDSPYEEFLVLCLIGGVVSVFVRGRSAAAILVLVFLSHVVVSSFFGGPQTRYVVAVKPILCIWGALGVVGLCDLVVIVARRTFARSGTSPCARPV